MSAPNRWLVAGAGLSALAALLHLGVIAWGAPGYRMFGAGERMAQLAEAGHWYPPVVTVCIAAVLGIWAAYALSGAGLIRRLPALKPILCAITAVYVLRGLVLIPLLVTGHAAATAFNVWSSAICLGYGVVHLIGLIQVWPTLRRTALAASPR
ncbi:hypothetical protein ACFQZQ_03715 [Lysobacter koreensis]|uniref:DUF3995 domain-containing protein n=1 Tax=Lysobacter koreensis TaxID=266122 RepID=A0ABW2YJE4_9GAMM